LSGESDGGAPANGETREEPEVHLEGEAEDVSAELAAAPPLATVLEAVLFAAAEPVPLGRLARLMAPWPRAAVVEALASLATGLAAGQRGVRLVETGGGFQLRSVAECAPWIRRFFTEKPPRLSRPLLETVAIIAYRQPVTRGEIESIRGVNCDAVLGALVTRSLVRVVGRRQSPGRPVEYGTSGEFLDLFSLRDLSELPPLPDPAALASLMVAADEDQEAGGDDADGSHEDRAESDGEAGSGAAPEDSEPGGDRLAEGSGGPDPGGTGAGQREADPRARDES
jgi:segregation and condensation protein B